MPGSIKIDDGSGNYTILTNAGSLGSDKTITIPNTTGTAALTSDVKIKQIVTAGGDETGSETNQLGFPIVTSLTASITPSSTSSKILIIVEAMISTQFGSGGGVINRDGKVGINRNNTASEGSTANGTSLGEHLVGARLTGTSTAEAKHFAGGSFLFLDSPSTTSATSYTLTTGILNTNIGITYYNDGTYASSITLMEI
jgi:hypothetical protein